MLGDRLSAGMRFANINKIKFKLQAISSLDSSPGLLMALLCQPNANLLKPLASEGKRDVEKNKYQQDKKMDPNYTFAPN